MRERERECAGLHLCSQLVLHTPRSAISERPSRNQPAATVRDRDRPTASTNKHKIVAVPMRTPLAGSTPNVHWRYVDTEELRAHHAVFAAAAGLLARALRAGVLPVDSAGGAAVGRGPRGRADEPPLDIRAGIPRAGRRAEQRALARDGVARRDAQGLRRAAQRRPSGHRPQRPELRAEWLRGVGRHRRRDAKRRNTDGVGRGAACARRRVAATAAQPAAAAARERAASISSVRCAWGSAQEAAALAAVLQYDEAATMEEIGLAMVDPADMPTEELRAAAAAGELPPIGASPDAMLRLGGGAAMEPLEVKNTCPFYTRRDRRLPRPPGAAHRQGAGARKVVRGARPMSQLLPNTFRSAAGNARDGRDGGALLLDVRGARAQPLPHHPRRRLLGEALAARPKFWLCVRRGEPPPPLAGSEEHAAFIEHTLALVKASEGARRHVSEPAPPARGRLLLDRKRAGKA